MTLTCFYAVLLRSSKPMPIQLLVAGRILPGICGYGLVGQAIRLTCPRWIPPILLWPPMTEGRIAVYAQDRIFTDTHSLISRLAHWPSATGVL